MHFALLKSFFYLGCKAGTVQHSLLPGNVLTTQSMNRVQVWRPLKGPVDDSPLVMIDASTVDKEDLMQYAIHFPGRTGYNYAVKHNPKHK